MIYIIIPVFNRKNYTRDCLNSLLKQAFKDYKIIVVNHGSTDGTAEMILNEYPGILKVTGDSTLWWTGATNLGLNKVLSISGSDEDFVLTLNNDLVVDPDYLDQLINIYQLKKPCLVGSTSVYYNNPEKIQFAGINWSPLWAKFKSNPIINNNYNAIRDNLTYVESDLLSGRGTMIPLIAFKQLGLYDVNRFPHYAADEDFSLSCKKAGYKLLVAIKAVVHSHVEDTGINFKYNRLTPSQFFKTLSSIKSANNLNIRFKWAKKNAAIPILYFCIDVIRIFGSYGRSIISKR